MADVNAAVFFTRDGFTASVVRGARGVALRSRFEGASASFVTPGPKTEGQVNYYVGEAASWRPGLETYAELTYRNAWPKIDVRFDPRPGALEYTAVIHPGGDPGAIALTYEGLEMLSLNERGDLVLGTVLGDLIESRPRTFQRLDGVEVEIPSRFLLRGPFSYGIEIGAYDRSKPLVVDPTLIYSTWVGGGYGTVAQLEQSFVKDIAIDASGNVFVMGTTSSDFPTTPGAFQPSLLDITASGTSAVFITKVAAGGTSLAWSTLLGGNGVSNGLQLQVDVSGNVFVTGDTKCADFPTTPGAYDTVLSGTRDAFVAKIADGGGTLSWSTFLGGTGEDFGLALGLDGSGNVVVAGEAKSTDFPTTPGAYQTTGTGWDVFVTRILAGGAALDWSTFLGGTSGDLLDDCVLDGVGNVYLVGRTGSSDFPTSPGAFQTTNPGGTVPWVAKILAGGATLSWSTFLGNGSSRLKGMAVDSLGFVHVAGNGGSLFPTTPGAYQTTSLGVADVVVTKLAIDGTGLVWSTFLGGGAFEIGTDIALDGVGQVYVSGWTTSADFPGTTGTMGASPSGGNEGFVARLSADGTTLGWAAYLGGAGDDQAEALAVDGSGNVYVTGSTRSPDFPMSSTGFMRHFIYATNQVEEIFVMRVEAGGTALGWSTFLHSSIGEWPGEVTADASGTLYITGRTFSLNYPTTPGAFSQNLTAASNAFLSKISGSTLVWSTYFGSSSGQDWGSGLVVDSNGEIYVAGYATAADFPSTPGIFQQTYGGGAGDGYVCKFNGTGQLVWSTFLGGTGEDWAESVCIGPGGALYVVGSTASTDFPTTAGAWSATPVGLVDSFVLQLNSAATILGWSTLIGGSGNDYVYAHAVDAAGNVYIGGETQSNDYATTPGSVDPTHNGNNDAFVAKILAGGARGWATYLGAAGSDWAEGIGLAANNDVLVSGGATPGFPTTAGAYLESVLGSRDGFISRIAADGSALVWSTLLGGNADDASHGLFVDPDESVFVVGFTASANFPVSLDAVQSVCAGSYDAFVAHLSSSGNALPWATYLGGTFVDDAWTVRRGGGGHLVVSGTTISADFPTTVNAVQAYGGSRDAFIAVFGGLQVNAVSAVESNGTYGLGATLTITVSFPSAVTVTGTPTLTLETGATDRVAAYSAGSGTATLSFSYTVSAGDVSSDLDTTGAGALQLAGGSIMDGSGGAVDLQLPTPGATGSLSSNKNLVIDTTAPDTQILSGPAASTTSTSATFTFSANESGCTFESRLDGGAWAGASSPQTFNGLSPSFHTFDVRAIDPASQTDASPASQGWTITDPAPDTQILSGPPASTTSRRATFTFSASEIGCSFESRLDGGAWAAASSPQTFTGLAVGAHTYEVRAIDSASQPDSTPAVYAWTINVAGGGGGGGGGCGLTGLEPFLILVAWAAFRRRRSLPPEE